jgi:hypothetical protein
MTESEFHEAVLRLVASPVDGLSFEDKAAMVRHAVTPRPVTTTVAAKVQGLRNALLCLVGVLTLVGCVSAMCLTWGVPLFYAMLGSLLALLGLVMVIILSGWLRDRNSSGPVLLDLGPNPVRNSLRKAAWSVGALAVSIGPMTGWLTKEAEVAIIAGGSLGLVALFFFLLSIGRLQVRESGLWVCWQLLRWGKIGSWRWEGDSALWVNTKGFFSWYQMILPIAPGQRKEVYELLIKHCSTVGPPNVALQPTGGHDGFPGLVAHPARPGC